MFNYRFELFQGLTYGNGNNYLMHFLGDFWVVPNKE